MGDDFSRIPSITQGVLTQSPLISQPKKKSKGPIPKEWIEHVTSIFEDPCWCEAFFLGLSYYISRIDQLRQIMDLKKLTKAFEEAKREIQAASWE